MANLKSLTKGTDFTVDGNSPENIKLSCLMRIADASEAMAQNFVNMQHDLDFYKKRCKEQRDVIATLERQLAGQKGAKTRLKNKILRANKQEPKE